MKLFEDYIDTFGVICRHETDGVYDGGDTLANEYTIQYCALFVETTDFERASNAVLKKLKTETGHYIRHPDPNKWYSNPETTSRDQITPVICTLAADKGRKQEFWQLLKLHAKRGFCFAWNVRRNFRYPTLEEHLQKSTPDVEWDYKWKVPDFCGPDIWSLWARGLLVHNNLWAVVLRPLHWLGDLHLLIGALINRYTWMFKKDKGTGRDGIDHDDRNFALKLHFSVTHYPTLFAYLAKYVYGLSRPLFCFESFWSKPVQEPPIHRFMIALYKKLWS